MTTSPKLSRRQLSLTLASGIGCALLRPTKSLANDKVQARRLANRIELWHNYVRKNQRLLARYTSRRESSLLYEPLIATGSLAFVAPATLVLRDDTMTGSTTRFSNPSRIQANHAKASPHTATRTAALRWLERRFITLFAPGDGEALMQGCRVQVPRSRTPRLELLPPRDSEVRKVIRSLRISFDPVGGAIREILLEEAQGDRFRLQLSDHRQDVPDEELDRVVEGNE